MKPEKRPYSTARRLLREASDLLVQELRSGGPEFSLANAVDHIEAARGALGERCDECQSLIPDHPDGGLANKHHEDSCSLYDGDAP